MVTLQELVNSARYVLEYLTALLQYIDPLNFFGREQLMGLDPISLTLGYAPVF